MTAPFTVAPPGYRLPAGIELGVVRLQVADLDRSVGYYDRVLGLRVLESTAEVATLAAQGDDTPLLELIELRGAAPVPRRGRLGLYHFALLLPDRPSLGRFARHLAALGEYAGMADHLVSEALYLTDPDGLGIEVYADRPRSSWREHEGVLAMATDPLDLDDLARVAGTDSWTSMPAGTRMGHIHLHVGDLDAAAAFYHGGLGLDRVVLSFPGALFMSAGGYHHHLGTNTWAAGAPTATTGDARLLEWTLRLPTPSDVDAAGRSLADSGHKVRRDSADTVATDPWGIDVRLTTRA
ncbi:MAG TPA: VOC family protein [Gemmatimonadales bacterium]|nr:VOC family protein [Gemmatimonadales bacterium]